MIFLDVQNCVFENKNALYILKEINVHGTIIKFVCYLIFSFKKQIYESNSTNPITIFFRVA